MGSMPAQSIQIVLSMTWKRISAEIGRIREAHLHCSGRMPDMLLAMLGSARVTPSSAQFLAIQTETENKACRRASNTSQLSKSLWHLPSYSKESNHEQHHLDRWSRRYRLGHSGISRFTLKGFWRQFDSAASFRNASEAHPSRWVLCFLVARIRDM